MLPRGHKPDVERKRSDSLPSVVDYALARVGRDLGCRIRSRGILDPNGWVLVEIDGAPSGKILIGNETLDDYNEAPNQREEDDRKADILRKVRQQVVERRLE